MSEKIYALLTFGGVWLLYIFPLYQGALELSEPSKMLSRFKHKQKKYPKISPWYWLIPPLKISKEKQRGIKILQDHLTSQKEMDRLFRYFNKAVAWYYIAIAGVLNGIVATRELLLTFDCDSLWAVVLVSVILVIIGFYHIHYRLNKERKNRVLTKIFNNPD